MNKCQLFHVAFGGFAPPEGVARVIYSHMPLLLGTKRHEKGLNRAYPLAGGAGFEPAMG